MWAWRGYLIFIAAFSLTFVYNWTFRHKLLVLLAVLFFHVYVICRLYLLGTAVRELTSLPKTSLDVPH
jgi:hypothetical protein